MRSSLEPQHLLCNGLSLLAGVGVLIAPTLHSGIALTDIGYTVHRLNNIGTGAENIGLVYLIPAGTRR